MRVVSKMWTRFVANKTRRVVAALVVICFLLTLQMLTRSRTDVTVEGPAVTHRLLQINEGDALTNQSADASPEPTVQPSSTSKPTNLIDVSKVGVSRQKVKDEIMNKMSTLDSKQLRSLWKLLSSMKDPHAVPAIRIKQALESLKVMLLEEVSGQKYAKIMEAAHNGRVLSQQARPKPLQIIISTTWRSGSTFLEELLASHPAVYNHYEPLMEFGLRQIREGADAIKAQKLLQNLLSCNYAGLKGYLDIAGQIQDMFRRNILLWQSCSSEEYGNAMCYNESYLNEACQLFPWSTMKLVRLRLRLLEPLLENQHLNARVVYLVRDPRGVINSRTATVKWCNSKDCNDPGYLCSDMDDDLNAALEFKKKYPGQLYILRYEDLALSPVNKTKELLAELGLDFDPKMQKFLNSHTTKNYDEPWSTSRVSKNRVTYWVDKLDETKRKLVQEACLPVMKRFGYLSINSTKAVTVVDILEPLKLPNS